MSEFNESSHEYQLSPDAEEVCKALNRVWSMDFDSKLTDEDFKGIAERLDAEQVEDLQNVVNKIKAAK